MKPSVAKKLNERIRALESELSITRNRSNIAELEKKVTVSVVLHDCVCACMCARESCVCKRGYVITYTACRYLIVISHLYIYKKASRS
jgi:ABC-type cobalamin/Fe3+-siderophores transport system ATPase subunit